MIDSRVPDAVKLDADVAGIIDVAVDMLDLVYGDRELQPRNGQQREACGSTPIQSIRQFFVFSKHPLRTAARLPEL